MKSQT